MSELGHRLRVEMAARPRGRRVLTWRYPRALRRKMRQPEREERRDVRAVNFGGARMTFQRPGESPSEAMNRLMAQEGTATDDWERVMRVAPWNHPAR